MLIETIPTACADRAMKNAHTDRRAIGATQIVGLRLAPLGLTRPTLLRRSTSARVFFHTGGQADQCQPTGASLALRF